MSSHEHGHEHHGSAIMDEETKKKLHETVEQIDHVHARKEDRVHEHRRVLAEYFGTLGQFAAEFTKDMGKADYQAVVTPPNQRVAGRQEEINLILKRKGENFVTFLIWGNADSAGTKVEALRSIRGVGGGKTVQLGGVDGKLNERLSAALIDGLKEAGEVLNRI